MKLGAFTGEQEWRFFNSIDDIFEIAIISNS